MKKKIAATIIVALLCAALSASNSHAYFDGGNGAGSGGSTCKYQNGWNWCSSYLAWYYYEFDPKVVGKGISGSITVPVDGFNYKNGWYDGNGQWHQNDGGHPTIVRATLSGQCATYSKGFYVSGYALMYDPGGTSRTDKYLAAINQFNGNNVGYGHLGYSGMYLSLKRSSNSGDYVNTTQKLNPNVSLPSGVSSVTVVPYDTVQKAWSNGASTYAAQANKNTDFNYYTYFCAGDANTMGRYAGNAKIKVNYNGSSDFSGNGDASTTALANDTPKHTISGTGTKTIYYEGSGEVHGQEFTLPNGYTKYNNTTMKVSTKVSMNGKEYEGTSTSSDMTGTITTGWKASDAGYKTLTMDPGDTVTICADNYYPQNYDNGSWSNYDTKEACVELEYINIEAELGSVTELKLKDDQNNVARAMGYNTSVAKSNLGNDIDSVALSATNYSQEASLNINPGQVTLSSLHKVTKVITQGDDMNLTLRDVKIKGTNSSGVQSQTSCTDDVIKSGLSYVDCYKTSGERNETVYPQDTVTYNVSTTTPTKINSGGVVNATEKTSSASITVTAGPVKCEKFDNAEIGVNAPFNYGRITLYGNNRQVSVGDINSNDTAGSQWKSSETVWLNPSNEISFYYDVCMGHQIANDKAGNGVNDEYSVSTSDALIDKLYTARRVSKSIQKTNTTSPDINATEINTSALGRIKANYSLSNQKTDTKNILTGIDTEQKIMLGHSVDSSMSWSSHGNHNGINSSDVTATLTLNTPYNYWLSVDPCINSTMIFIGQKLDCTIYPKVNERFNGDVGSSYKTDIKTTKHLVAKLMIDANVTADQVKSLNGTVEGDYTNIDSIRAHLTGGLGSGYELKLGDGDSELLTYDSSSSEEFRNGFKLDYGEIEGGEEVGAKYCFVSALYPSDSHNTGYNGKPEDEGNDKYAISKGANQNAALIGDTPGDGAKTRITVSCATIGKKPSVSIEGGSLSAGGQVLGYVTNYKNRKYGSWAEYDLLSDEVSIDGTDKGFGSGASFAYVNPTSSKNAAVDAIDAGISATSLAYPQSYGNMESGKYGATEESNRVANVSSSTTDSEPLSWKFATAIRKQFIENSESTANTWRSINISDIATSSALPTISENTFYVLYSKGKITIDQDIENDANKSVVVIYSEGGIDITDNVSRVDAFLIAYDPDKSIPPGIDTCHVERQNESGNYVDIARKGASNGNQTLLEYCSNPLQVNGAVLTHSITLDRVYGGGSESEIDDLDPKYLVKRAEIFSYDPRIVFWSFDFTWNEKNANSSYVVELTPRL